LIDDKIVFRKKLVISRIQKMEKRNQAWGITFPMAGKGDVKENIVWMQSESELESECSRSVCVCVAPRMNETERESEKRAGL
jgi:hypothetical protein